VLLDGVRFYLNYEDGWFSNYVAVHGYWEKMETEAVRAHVRPGMRVLDIGAHTGYYTILFSNLVGERGRVIAFEPEPASFLTLQRNIEGLRYHNVELVNKAVWDATGEVGLNINRDDSLDHSIVVARDGMSSVTVDAIAVDDYVGDATFDVIKMDIQGGEGRAMRGMQRTLARHLPEVIVTELWPSALEKASTPASRLFQELLDLGYDIYVIDEDRKCIEPTTWSTLYEQSRGKDWVFFNLLCLRRPLDGPR